MALNQSKLELWKMMRVRKGREKESFMDVSSPSTRHDFISAGRDRDEELPVFKRKEFLD